MQTKRIPAEDRKNLIIKAATKVFAEKGFQGTKTKDIAYAAGISEAMIFKLFKNKDDLYNSIINSNVKDHTNKLGNIFSNIENFSTILKQFVLQAVNSVEKNPDFLRLMLYGAMEKNQLTLDFFKSYLGNEVEGFSKTIKNGIEQKKFREINPKLAAQIFQTMIIGYTVMQSVLVLNEEDDANEKMADAMVDIFFNGLIHNNKTFAYDKIFDKIQKSIMGIRK